MKSRLIICAIVSLFATFGAMAQTTELGNGNVKIEPNDATSNPMLTLDQQGAGDSSMEFNQSTMAAPFSVGVDGFDLNFKLTNTGILTGGVGSFQGDTFTMMQVWQPGIVDFNNQSRARAFLTHIQFIPFSVWTPIEFDDDFTPPGGYDQQNEFTVWTPTPTPAVFIAKVEGFYQINARTEFEYIDPAQLGPNGYVSIAIFVTTAGGTTAMHSQGNNLQMVDTIGGILFFNNAPNVSDVVYLQVGDMVDIRAWQSVEAGPGVMSLMVGTEKTYVSIHKIS
jgi:hypothetical protein